MKLTNLKLLLVSMLALTLVGCATAQFKGRADLLDFLADGTTTRDEAVLKLGQPSGSFENEKIFTYRLGFDPRNKGYYVVERAPGVGADDTWTTWWNTKYSLVLVFDGQNVLRQHSLVEVERQ